MLADDGVDADAAADGERPGELARGCADAEEIEERLDDARLEDSRVWIRLWRHAIGWSRAGRWNAQCKNRSHGGKAACGCEGLWRASFGGTQYQAGMVLW